MRLLVYDIQGKIFVKARHLKRQSASRVKIRTPWKGVGKTRDGQVPVTDNT